MEYENCIKLSNYQTIKLFKFLFSRILASAIASVVTFLPTEVTASTNFATYGNIENCYQRMDLGANSGTFGFLNLGGNGQFRFSQTGSPPHINLTTDFVRIEVSDGNGSYQDLFDLGGGLSLADVNFNWVNHTFNGVTFPVIQIKKSENGSYIVNNNWFTFGDVSTARLTIFQGGSEIITDLNFFNTLDEAVTFQPGDSGSCYKFDPFSLNSVTGLDGLCNPIGSSRVTISPLPGTPIESYMPANSSLVLDVFKFSSKNTTSTGNFDVSDWCDDCFLIFMPYVPGPPFPCGCTGFTLNFTLLPCTNSPPECETLTLTKTIQICCRCDIRSSPPLH